MGVFYGIVTYGLATGVKLKTLMFP